MFESIGLTMLGNGCWKPANLKGGAVVLNVRDPIMQFDFAAVIRVSGIPI